MPMQNRDNSPHRRRGRRRKRPPTRFTGGGAPPLQEPQQHAPQQQQIQENPVAVMDSDGSGTDPEEYDEVITISLSELRGNVQCPICLGIVKKTRTVMGCLHRFCGECIDKSMRLGNNECPACRMHCASRRSLRDDHVFDALVSSVYKDLEKYEQEELVLFEEERAANEKIQASMNECFLRQSEATRVRKTRATSSRMGRTGFCFELGESSNAETDRMIHGDDHHPVSTFPTPCIVAVAADEEDAERLRPSASSPANADLPVWGGAGYRSHQARRGGGANGKGIQSSRVEKLVDHLANVEKNDHKDVVTAHLRGGEVVWIKDSDASASVVVERLGKEFKTEAKGRAPHISGSVLNLVMQGERLMDAMKNGMNS